jgi:hypothetical protein
MVVCWLLAAAPALAQAALPLHLRWHAPGACPAASEVHAELARLARVREGFALEPLHADVEVARERGVYRARLHTTHAGHAGTRSLDARDCATLVKSVALVLALSFGEGVEVTPSAATATAATEAASRGIPEAQSTTAPTAAPAPTPLAAPTGTAPAPGPATQPQQDASALDTAPAPRPLRTRGTWHYLVGVGTQINLLGPAMASVSAQLELERKALSLGLRATGSFAPERAVTAEVDTRFSAASAVLEACGVLGNRSLSGSLCGGGHAGMLHGSSSGAIEGGSYAPWGALSASAALTWPRSFWLRLRLQAGLAVSLYRARFVIKGLDEVERVGQLVPELALLMLFAP